MEPGQAGAGNSGRELPAALGMVHTHRQQVGLGESVHRLLDLGVEGDPLAVEGRLMGIVLLVVRGEVAGREVLTQVEQTVEGLPGMFAESGPPGEVLDVEPFEKQEVDVAA